MLVKTHVCVPLVMCITTVSVPATVADEPVAELVSYMQACVKVDNFNGSVLVCKDNRTVIRNGYGMANFEHDVPNTPDTKFRIGSITKQFTAMAVMILEERGKLKVEDRVSEYVVDPPYAWADVTIHHLLTHTSGVPSFTSMPEYRRDMMLPQTIEQMLAKFKDEPLDFAPGEKYAYSNSGYFLLGAIIEKASGVSYEQFIRTEICEPLELHDTGYDRFHTMLKHRASGYKRLAGAIVHDAYLDMSQPYAAGSLYSTVEDLSRWDQALRRKELISDERYEKMYTPEKKQNYAYGWGVRTQSGRKTISHGGGINGFLSYILRYPEQKLCVVVLCNVLPANPGKVAKDLAAIMLGDDYEIPKLPEIADVDPDIFDAYVGRYQISADFILTVKRVDDKLTTQATGQGELTILPESKTTFFNTQVKARMTFVQDDSGNTIALILKQRGREIRAERIAETKSE
ncbi:MAG: serine hydrolase [Fuerstiella sp.]|nr:serine hydrolase [Fuerstiella sp.]